MSFGKGTAVILGGMVLVGAVGAAAVSGSLASEANVPVGPFVIQVPTELWSLQPEQTLVVDPNIIEAPEQGLTALFAVEQVPEALVPPEMDKAQPVEDIEVVRLSAQAAQAEAAAQAATQVQASAFMGCSGAH